MRTRIINRGGFRWFNDRNATSIVYPTTKNLCRWWVNFESGFTTTSKIGMIVVRIGDVETPGRTEIDLDIKDKDLAGSSFFFFSPSIFSPLHPFQRVDSMSITSTNLCDASRRNLEAKTTLTKEIFILGVHTGWKSGFHE